MTLVACRSPWRKASGIGDTSTRRRRRPSQTEIQRASDGPRYPSRTMSSGQSSGGESSSSARSAIGPRDRSHRGDGPGPGPTRGRRLASPWRRGSGVRDSRRPRARKGCTEPAAPQGSRRRPTTQACARPPVSGWNRHGLLVRRCHEDGINPRDAEDHQSPMMKIALKIPMSGSFATAAPDKPCRASTAASRSSDRSGRSGRSTGGTSLASAGG